MYFIKTPTIAQSFIKKAIWNIPNKENKIYLTFDDGPTPNITKKTLAILKENGIKATFFCLGGQAEKYPEIFKQIKQEGHGLGNHSYSHLKGWNTNSEVYCNDVQKGKEITKSTFFRPPYGKIKRSQAKKVGQHSKIIMWDVLPGDFSPKNTVEQVVFNAVNNTESGSIIVLHDNDKCGEKMLSALPEIIKQLKEKGFVFEEISMCLYSFS